MTWSWMAFQFTHNYPQVTNTWLLCLLVFFFFQSFMVNKLNPNNVTNQLWCFIWTQGVTTNSMNRIVNLRMAEIEIGQVVCREVARRTRWGHIKIQRWWMRRRCGISIRLWQFAVIRVIVGVGIDEERGWMWLSWSWEVVGWTGQIVIRLVANRMWRFARRQYHLWSCTVLVMVMWLSLVSLSRRSSCVY